jgi:hypothetical protein
MNVLSGLVAATKQTFQAGNLTPTYHEIGVSFLLGPEADPTSPLSPIVKQLVHDGMSIVIRRLTEEGIRVVGVNGLFYSDGERRQPGSLREAYFCMPKARQPASGIVKIEDSGSYLWRAFWQSQHLAEVSRRETYERKIDHYIQHHWLTRGDVDQLSRQDFLRLTGRN